MAAPTSYTEEELGQYMVTVLTTVAEVLGFTSPNDFTEEINEAIILYGADSIGEATDIPKIRACARYQAWRKASAALITKYSFQTDQQRFDRSDMGRMVKYQLSLAETDLSVLGVDNGYVIEVGTIAPVYNPYAPTTDQDYEDLGLL